MLGAAWIADIAVLPAINDSHNCRLVTLASRSPERAREVLAPYPDARVADSYDALLADREVDAVYIPLVNNLHKTWTLRALAAGKHVLCEKPLAMNAREAEEMASAATAADRLLMEGFMYRFNPRVQEFVGGLSEPLFVQAGFGFTLEGEHNYRFASPLGGGALLDVGCYGVNVSRWILGEPIDVIARMHEGHGVDMTTTALLVFGANRTASVFASFESAEHQEVTVITRDAVHRLDRPFNPLDDPIQQYRLMVESFADSVLNHHPVAIPPSESIANMRVIDRIREALSAAT
ncbi:MAG TPA: Gfo/Idh/MocA family oxidoreductase [Candidatus Dormibacteraeota bacterium]|nr:Gfo/Idh/MocA family oxidoreductase [Candidatus Dormibacteraeota bacterium]